MTKNSKNGKTFTVEAINQSDKNIYVQKMSLNGKPLNSLTIKHSDITNGSKLVFYMGAKPKNKQLRILANQLVTKSST
jgi:putative alpha-1,2-mannosidase